MTATDAADTWDDGSSAYEWTRFCSYGEKGNANRCVRGARRGFAVVPVGVSELMPKHERLTRDTPIQDFSNQPLACGADFRERPLIRPSLHKARLGQRDSVGVDIVGFREEGICGSDVRSDICASIVGKR